MRSQKNSAGNLLPTVFTWNASNQPIRVEIINNQPYFIAKDVCDVLQLTEVSNTIARLDDDEKLTRTVFVSGQNRQMWLVNESGLYSLIFQSRKAEAKAFRKWVTSQVLPAIRRTGGYQLEKKRGGSFIDLRCELYQVEQMNGFRVRSICHDGLKWYSVNDVLRAMKVRTPSCSVAKKLNVKRENAIKIYVFGNTHPAWFMSEVGLKLVVTSSRGAKVNECKLLSGGQSYGN